jgi:hypothetical protein
MFCLVFGVASLPLGTPVEPIAAYTVRELKGDGLDD